MMDHFSQISILPPGEWEISLSDVETTDTGIGLFPVTEADDVETSGLYWDLGGEYKSLSPYGLVSSSNKLKDDSDKIVKINNK